MSCNEFNALEKSAKVLYLNRLGKLIDERAIYAKHTLQIHKLHDFYVQVYYNHNDNSVTEIRGVLEGGDWEAYLKKS